MLKHRAVDLSVVNGKWFRGCVTTPPKAWGMAAHQRAHRSPSRVLRPPQPRARSEPTQQHVQIFSVRSTLQPVAMPPTGPHGATPARAHHHPTNTYTPPRPQHAKARRASGLAPRLPESAKSLQLNSGVAFTGRYLNPGAGLAFSGDQGCLSPADIITSAVSCTWVPPHPPLPRPLSPQLSSHIRRPQEACARALSVDLGDINTRDGAGWSDWPKGCWTWRDGQTFYNTEGRTTPRGHKTTAGARISTARPPCAGSRRCFRPWGAPTASATSRRRRRAGPRSARGRDWRCQLQKRRLSSQSLLRPT